MAEQSFQNVFGIAVLSNERAETTSSVKAKMPSIQTPNSHQLLFATSKETPTKADVKQNPKRVSPHT